MTPFAERLNDRIGRLDTGAATLDQSKQRFRSSGFHHYIPYSKR